MAAKNVIRPVTVPMAGTPGQSVKNARIDSSMTYGVSGDPRRFGVNETRNIEEAEELIESTTAGRVVTGRSRETRFTGA